MKHEKTFEAISKLKDIEIELHRLKNALELANKGLDAQLTWVGLTDLENAKFVKTMERGNFLVAIYDIEKRLKEKNT